MAALRRYVHRQITDAIRADRGPVLPTFGELCREAAAFAGPATRLVDVLSRTQFSNWDGTAARWSGLRRAVLDIQWRPAHWAAIKPLLNQCQAAFLALRALEGVEQHPRAGPFVAAIAATVHHATLLNVRSYTDPDGKDLDDMALREAHGLRKGCLREIRELLSPFNHFYRGLYQELLDVDTEGTVAYRVWGHAFRDVVLAALAEARRDPALKAEREEALRARLEEERTAREAQQAAVRARTAQAHAEREAARLAHVEARLKAEKTAREAQQRAELEQREQAAALQAKQAVARAAQPVRRPLLVSQAGLVAALVAATGANADEASHGLTAELVTALTARAAEVHAPAAQPAPAAPEARVA